MRDDELRDDELRKVPGRSGDEQALRSLLAGAVGALEPAEGALERLRHAVPARRARKRNTLVGATAAIVLAGIVVPAALHLRDDRGATAGHSAIAGHGATQGTTTGGPADPHHNGAGAGAQPSFTKPAGKDQEAGGAGGQPVTRTSGSPSGGAVAGPSSAGASAGTSTGTGPGTGAGPQPPVAAPGVPGCTAEQLGVLGSARAPEADGKVYGSFKVTNVSARGCVVSSPDTVTAAPVDGPPPPQGSGVSVTGHTAGDPASGLLPDPSAEEPLLMLQPNTGYEVRFAWVPSAQSCPAATTGPTAEPSQEGTQQTPTDTERSASADGDGAAAPAPPSEGPAEDPAGVEVSHTPGTPVAGAPVTQTTIPEACGGTVYRTGFIPLDAP
ncbi:hypothetical protein ACWDYJ_26870 [Streptomyces sp. NPDC003042]